jgi:hypothetical protein
MKKNILMTRNTVRSDDGNGIGRMAAFPYLSSNLSRMF